MLFHLLCRRSLFSGFGYALFCLLGFSVDRLHLLLVMPCFKVEHPSVIGPGDWTTAPLAVATNAGSNAAIAAFRHV